MAYSSRNGRRPDELASKSSHSYIINDKDVKAFIAECEYPKSKDSIVLDPSLIISIDRSQINPIEHIIAVDGSYSTVPLKKTFPSSLITFFQFGELLLNTKDLDEISQMPFISRASMAKIKELERAKLVLPTKNVAYKKSLTLTHSVRRAIYEFFKSKDDGTNLLETVYWLIFEMYNSPLKEYSLSRCPNCNEKDVSLIRTDFDSNFISRSCNTCNLDIFITDVFRLHEAIDDELGASGILGYLTNLIEQINIIHTIKNIKQLKADLLNHFLFLKDGPLAFFGQTANMHDSVRRLCNYLFANNNLFLAGLEKSGAFVEHADEIKEFLKPGEAFLLSNKHIYSYILPNDPDTPEPYARTSYYSAKIIFKSIDNRMYVITLPVENENIVMNPQKADFKNIDTILLNIEKLRCDMYDNAIVPVALANKLISLSVHPSSVILEKFAKKTAK
ncbi:MAG: DNA double-strand break repair nuclease NurA [Bacteroidetes bacterium]|nr:DNA double-strand break repair nuclease NurA [Bacteroidota bacterium]